MHHSARHSATYARVTPSRGATYCLTDHHIPLALPNCTIVHTPTPQETPMNPDAFKTLLQDVTRQIGDRALDARLQAWLNDELGAASPTYRELKAACEQGVAEGWLCQREGGGLRYGRIFKPDDALHRFSVDVVDMNSLAGAHHAHPLGEIDLIMPLDATATFD